MAVVDLTPVDTEWTVPAGVTVLDSVEMWGAGGNGGSAVEGGGGGGGGEYAKWLNVPAIPLETWAAIIDSGGANGECGFTNEAFDVALSVDDGGNASGRTGGSAGIDQESSSPAKDITNSGGTGGTNSGTATGGAGGGGGGAAEGVGEDGQSISSGTTPGVGGAGGDGGETGNGGNGGAPSAVGNNGSDYGGGGGGGGAVSQAGGTGAPGHIRITYTEAAGPEGDACLQPIGTQSADCFVYRAAPNSANLNPDLLIVGAGATTSDELRTLLEFDINDLGIPAGSTIDSATLILNTRVVTISGTGLGGPDSLSFDRLTASFNENTVTWNTQPSVAGAPFAIARTPTSLGGVDESYGGADMLASVVDAIDNRSGIWRYRIYATTLVADTFVGWAAGEIAGGNSGDRPEMCITYTAPNGLPDCVTLPATGVTTNDGTLNGEVVDDGGAAVTARFVFGYIGVTEGSWDPEADEAHFTFIDEAGGEGTFGESFSENTESLPQGTTVYYRACAENANGVFCGAIESFTTEGTRPGASLPVQGA